MGCDTSLGVFRGYFSCLGLPWAASLVVSSTTSSDSFSFFGGDGKVVGNGSAELGCFFSGISLERNGCFSVGHFFF